MGEGDEAAEAEACVMSGSGGHAHGSGEHGPRKTELVCIGQELDHAAAAAALDRCLLTEREMARGVRAWATLPDPFREKLKHEHGHGHTHADAYPRT